MPHLIIEYAQELATADQVTQMLDAVHDAAYATGLFEQSHIRTRAIPVEFYRTGTSRAPFVHAQLRIHSGRDATQKRLLSGAVLTALCDQGWDAESVTVEVVDMDKQTYARHTR